MIHNSRFRGNLRYIYDEMKRRETTFRFVVVSKEKLFHPQEKNRIINSIKKCYGMFYFYIILNYHLAHAAMILLNDNFLPLAYMPISKKTKLVQLWHGVGAFKRFGLSTETDPFVRKLVSEGNRKIDYLFVSSPKIVGHYQEAMGIDKNKIYPVGVPVTDYYFNQGKRAEALERIYQAYPILKNKIVLLYTPTYRPQQEENLESFKRLQPEKLLNQLGNEYILLLRFHPQVYLSISQNSGLLNVSTYSDIKDLYEVADYLITDYSSTVVEFSLLDKPIIFFAYDFERFDRGFYVDYKEVVPGPIVQNGEQVANTILEYQREEIKAKYHIKRDKFIALQCDMADGHSSERVTDILLMNGEQR